MHPQVRASFGDKPRTHRKKARQQFLAVAKKKRPRISKIRNAIQQQLGHLERNLASIDALIACGGSLLAAGRHWYHKLLVVSELVRQQKILYHSDSRSITDRIVRLYQAHFRPIVRGKARSNVEFGAKISISVTALHQPAGARQAATALTGASAKRSGCTGPDGPQTSIQSRPSDLRPAQDRRRTGLWSDQRSTGPRSIPVARAEEGRRGMDPDGHHPQHGQAAQSSAGSKLREGAPLMAAQPRG